VSRFLWPTVYTPLTSTWAIGPNIVADNTGLSSFVSPLFGSQICKIPRNSERIRTYSNSRSSKVIQGHRSGWQSKSTSYWPLIIILYVPGTYRFRDIDVKSWKM